MSLKTFPTPIEDEIQELRSSIRLCTAAEELAKDPDLAILITVHGGNGTKIKYWVDDNNHAVTLLRDERWKMEGQVSALEKEAQAPVKTDFQYSPLAVEEAPPDQLMPIEIPDPFENPPL